MELTILIIPVLLLLQLLGTDANCSGGTTKIKLAKKASAYLSSPNYPFANYSRNQSCRWMYTAKEDESLLRIEVYRSYFEETTTDSQDCSDYVAVYKGTQTFLGLQLGRFCGISEAKTFESDIKGSFYVEFKSNDDNNVGRGFAAKVVCVDKRFPVEVVLGPIAGAVFILGCLLCHMKKKRDIRKAAVAQKAADEKKKAEAKKKADAEAKKKADEDAKKKAEEEAKKTKDQSTSPLKTATNSPDTVSFISNPSVPYGNHTNISFLGATGGVNPLPGAPTPSYESLYPSTIDTTGNVVVNFNHPPPSGPVYNPPFPEQVFVENGPSTSQTKPPPYTK